MFILDLENCHPDIKKKRCINKNTQLQYTILNYDRNSLLYDKTERLYRSVILSDPEGELLSFSHPRSEVLQIFRERFPKISPDQIYINEIIEGTMIQLFWDSRKNDWEIATKGSVGADSWFYRTYYPEFDDGKTVEKSQKTFRDMFFDVFPSFSAFDHFPKDHCYQFILQHPENPIVLHIQKPAVYLVGVYQLLREIQTEIKVLPINPTEYEQWRIFMTTPIQFPKRIIEESYDDIIEKYCSIHSNYKTVGYMILDIESGERTSIENPVYKEVRELRGNHPNLQYQYLCLRRINKIQPFLHYFPQYKKIFYRFHTQYSDFLSAMHQSYLTYYIQKKGVKISKRYFPLIYRIHHTVYLPSINSGERKIMRLREIAEYIGNLDPSELIYYLNYHIEERLSISDNCEVLDQQA